MLEGLLIELRRLAEGPVERSGRLPVEGPLWADAGIRFVEPPHLSLTAQANAGGGVQVEGLLDARVRLVCRRCLTEREERCRVPLRFILEPGLEAGSEDEGVFSLRPEGDLVDLGPIIREELLLAVPEYPQCRPDCKGLCPHCGIDLNQGTCDCEAVEVDPRWEALRKLRS